MVPMMGNKVALNSAVFAKDENVAIAYGMGITAEKVAAQWKVTREEQDAFAVASHRKAAAAIAAGHFREEILPYEIALRVARPRHRQGGAPQEGGRHRRGPAPGLVAWRASGSCGPPSRRAAPSPPATARRCPTAPAPWSS